MKIKAWCEQKRISYSDLGRRIGVQSPETARRYADGIRIPGAPHMVSIYLATAGQVTPNDFYDLPALPETSDPDTRVDLQEAP